jgi:hypothetical protein
MFVGHFGIAELGKAPRRELPIIWLAIAAYLPDITRFVLPIITSEQDRYSHAIPAVLVQGVVIGLLWKLRGGTTTGSLVIALVCWLHWPADAFTGCKPTTLDGPWVGLGSYRRPISDLGVELLLLIAGWALIRRRQRGFSGWWLLLGVFLQLGFLVSMYWGSQFYIGHREWIWKPGTSLRPTPHSYESWSCRPKAEE